jgi:hypothetical protein
MTKLTNFINRFRKYDYNNDVCDVGRHVVFGRRLALG